MNRGEAIKILSELKWHTEQALKENIYGRKVEEGEREKLIVALDIALKELLK